MAFQYCILPEQSLIFARFAGPACLSDLTAIASIICSDPAYVRSFDGLLDLTDLEVSISVADISELVSFTESNRKQGYGRWAILASTPIATAYTMIYRQRVSPALPVTLFSTYEGAARYLGKPIDEATFDLALADELRANLAAVRRSMPHEDSKTLPN